MSRIVALLVLLAPAFAFAADPEVSPILFINRCKGGCTIKGGFDDARANASSIPCAGTVNCSGGGCVCNGGNAGDYFITEFENSQGQTGAAADAEWAQLMECIREVYSPYNIQVVDTLPAGGLSHNQGIAAGEPVNIGYGNAGIGGIATSRSACDPADNIISFSFTNIYQGPDRIENICATVAQETAHAYGLDHAFEFSDGRTACPDPMSYRSDCGGRRFFRNDSARCGEFAAAPCRCGGFQNSHQRLTNIFGPGTPTTAAPTLTVSAPTPNAQIVNATPVIATASAPRGVFRLELWLNGYKWTTIKGAPFTSLGQPETTYSMPIPAGVPDGIIDIVVKAYDDINVMTESAPITVTKGAPCTEASQCAKGQACDAGRCFWDPPTGEVGDACDYPQFCVSENCLETTSGMYCSQDCVVGVDDSCPMGFSCEGMAGQTGFCVTESPEDPGCCSTTSDGRVASLVSLLVLGLVLRRRRR